MTALSFDGWTIAPSIGLVLPEDGMPGWADAAFWCAQLEAWGFPADRLTPDAAADDTHTTLIVPAPAVDDALAASLPRDRTGLLLTGAPTPAAAAIGDAVRFDTSAGSLDWRNTEQAADAAFAALERAAARHGLVGLWRWPRGKAAALVVDGDVDHPTGVDPECSRYVAPAIETARLARFEAYGIFAAAANVDSEPGSFPPAGGYYNHSYTHPYSHWNPEPWEALDESQMEDELGRSNDTFLKRLGRDDEGIFRLPHFQLEASDRTYTVLDRLGYRAESSIGGNVSITSGLPFHPALAAWGGRGADAAYARTHPDPAKRHAFLQLPISTDPTDPAFPHGCCSYNTLAEDVRNRTADPADYEAVLEEVLLHAIERRNVAHLFIDPPDAGYGRLPGDHPDYASAVEGWMRRAVERDDLAILTTSGLATWWLEREAAIRRLSCRVEGGRLVAALEDPPAGATIALLSPGGGWTHTSLAKEDA